MNFDDVPDLIQGLVDEGCLIPGGIQDGEQSYLVDFDVMQALHPTLADEFRQDMVDEVEADIIGLILKGLVEFAGVDDDGEFLYQITTAGSQYMLGMMLDDT